MFLNYPYSSVLNCFFRIVRPVRVQPSVITSHDGSFSANYDHALNKFCYNQSTRCRHQRPRSFFPVDRGGAFSMEVPKLLRSPLTWSRFLILFLPLAALITGIAWYFSHMEQQIREKLALEQDPLEWVRHMLVSLMMGPRFL